MKFSFLFLTIPLFPGSCKFINCLNGKQCIEDQNFLPQCMTCPKCSRTNRTLDIKKLVCGADGITYRSMCELRQKSCKIGKSIQLAYRGPCTGKKDNFLLPFYVAIRIFFRCLQIIFAGNQKKLWINVKVEEQEVEAFDINFN